MRLVCELEVCNNTKGDPVTYRWATHGSDISYIFASTSGPNIIDQTRIDCPMTSDEQEFQGRMQSFWGEFVRTGHSGIPEQLWPLVNTFDMKASSTLALRSMTEGGIEPLVGYKAEECDFWLST